MQRQVRRNQPRHSLVFCQPTLNVIVVSCGQLKAQTVRPEFAQGLPDSRHLLKLF